MLLWVTASLRGMSSRMHGLVCYIGEPHRPTTATTTHRVPPASATDLSAQPAILRLPTAKPAQRDSNSAFSSATPWP
jgi:hypothetical protein